jgi:hypothetical protein
MLRRQRGWDDTGRVMPHLQVEATSDQLLQAVAQLPPDELATFVERVLTLRAERVAPHVAHDEASLLLRINRALPEELQGRFEALVALRRIEQLTPEQHAELLRLTDTVEQFEADRAGAIAELARLRGMTITDIMRSLGIEPPAYA